MQKLSIFLSASTCIYENLALEEWIFRNQNLSNDGDALLIWRNNPAVVIGKYQNPWLEANVFYCQEKAIRLARRFSGGGAVYHDLGNLNISILTSHERHNRKQNLRTLVEQLNADLSMLPSAKIAANSRDDLILEPTGIKISGTAARISHGKAYHHFTLLVDANLQDLRHSLQSPLKDKIETTATRSVRANSVGCIAQKMAIQYPSSEQLIEIVKASVIRGFASQYRENTILDLSGNRADKFNGMDEIRSMLKSEEWIFGRSPKFSLKLLDGRTEELRTVYVENGRIKESNNSEFPVGKSFNEAFLYSRYSKLFLN